DVYDGEQHLGAVQRKWAWFHRIFAIENSDGQEVMELRSPFFHPWTFTLTFQGHEAGVIRKKWGGLLKEMFTDADVFGVEMGESIPVEVRKLLLVATFLVDFTCFENNQGGGSVLDVFDG
ncbi:MAG: scramblase, partial [Planctomycetes bacterium]|nr:scramblase [Planctomycetota bacterium]